MKITTLLAAAVFAFLLPLPASADDSSNADEIFKKMAKKLSRAEKKLPNKTVAVYGFEVIGKPDDTYGRYATEKLTHEIVSEGSFMVIERSRIDQVLKEQSLSLTGTVDPGTAARIGKILAVDAVVIGTIVRSDTGAEFIARVIQSEKGIILASANERVRMEAPAEKAPDEKVPAKKAAVTEKETPAVELPAKKIPAKKTVEYETGNVKLSIERKSYDGSGRIVFSYAGLPGHQNDWISLVEASSPDTSYDQWFYTYGQTSGTHVFDPVKPGDYEIRVYFDWPNGGYVVRKRLKISVK